MGESGRAGASPPYPLIPPVEYLLFPLRLYLLGQLYPNFLPKYVRNNLPKYLNYDESRSTVEFVVMSLTCPSIFIWYGIIVIRFRM